MPIDNTNAALADVDIHYLDSRSAGDQFKIFVAHPVLPLPPGTKPPVIYALDANFVFGMVTDAARMMGMFAEVPPAYVVGIGYRGGWMLPDPFVKRSRDMTPTPLAVFDELGAALIPGLGGVTLETGRADRFLAFLRDELKPFIESRYPVDPTDALLTGASLGGLCTLYALFTQPDLFQRYLACSPSIWWDNEALLGLEAAYATTHQDLKARVFIATGADETNERFHAIMSHGPEGMRRLKDGMVNRDGKLYMAEYLDTFVPTLQRRGYPSLRLASHRFDGENHNSVYGPALSKGLRALYAKPDGPGR